MRLSVSEARAVIQRCMEKVGHSGADAAIIADHLIDCELRGLSYGGMSRCLSIIERLTSGPDIRKPLMIVRETPVSAFIDAGNQAGYLLGHRATTLAIEKAKTAGIGVVGGFRSWYTGMYSYYMEMATRENLVAMCSGGSMWRVAPYGGTEGRFGTNPIAFGFPTDGDPIIVDFGTSAIMIAQATLARRLGTTIPEGVAFDPAGNPTCDPDAALRGAFAVWGGPKGSALATAVQILGIMCGSPVNPSEDSDGNLFVMVMRPDLFMPADEFKHRVSEYADLVRATRPLDKNQKPRMPFDRSAQQRRASVAKDIIEVPDAFYGKLTAFLGKM